ncbi:MAG TPA: YggT family protein [Clostridia bacterium]
MGFFIASVLVRVLELIEIAVLLRSVLSWIPSAREGAIMRILVQLTEPLLSPVRRLIESPL